MGVEKAKDELDYNGTTDTDWFVSTGRISCFLSCYEIIRDAMWSLLYLGWAMSVCADHR